LNGYPNAFEGDYFDLKANEIVQFHTADRIYFGTWTTFYIGDDLHLNIYINAGGEIADAWNYDWNSASFSDVSIELESSNNRTLIEKDCAIDCSLDSYQVCEIATNPGFAEFSFKDYAECIPMPFSHDLASPVRLTYYETEVDAMDGINPVSHTDYINITNPQTIYVRIEYLDTGEVLGFWEFIIEAVSC
jgi:hypothetical protein